MPDGTDASDHDRRTVSAKTLSLLHGFSATAQLLQQDRASGSQASTDRQVVADEKRGLRRGREVTHSAMRSRPMHAIICN